MSDGEFDVFLYSGESFRDLRDGPQARARRPRDPQPADAARRRRRTHPDRGRGTAAGGGGRRGSGDTPVDVELLPAALKVLLPPARELAANSRKSPISLERSKPYHWGPA